MHREARIETEGWAGLRGRLALAAVVLLALLLRLPSEGLPPGLYRDEAYYALDALATWVEGARLWYPANNGREPLFIWILTPLVALLGPSPAAIRLPAAFVGALAVAATGALGRGLWGPRAGLVAAALLAVAPWPVWLGRLGFRATLLPAVLAMAGAAMVVGWRRRASGRAHARAWLAFGGLLAGIGHATYAAAMVAPLAAGGWLLWRVLSRPRLIRSRVAWGDVLFWLAPWALLAGAVAWAATAAGGAPWDRAAQVAILANDSAMATGAGRGGGSLRILLGGMWDAAGLVFLRGDVIARHNVPGRPFLAPAMALLWGLGLLRLMWAMLASRGVGGGARGAGAAVAVLAWLLVLALPTALAEDAPHFLRAVGLLPALAVVAGVGADVLLRAAARRGRWFGVMAWGLVVGALAIELMGSLGYARLLRAGQAMDPWANGAAAPGDVGDDVSNEDARPLRWMEPGGAEIGGAAYAWRRVFFAFEGAASELARRAAVEAGHGWDGGWVAPWPGETAEGAAARLAAGEVAGVQREQRPPPAGERKELWLDRRLRDGWTSLALMAPLESMRLVDPYDPVLEGERGVAFIVPSGIEAERMWATLAQTATIHLESLPVERGDLAPMARALGVQATAERGASSARGGGVAAFAGGPELMAVTVLEAAQGGWVIESHWRRDGDEPLSSGEPWVELRAMGSYGAPAWAGDAAPLGLGVLPLSTWGKGQVIVQRQPLRIPEGTDGRGIGPGVALEIGLRAGEDGAWLQPSSAAGRVMGDRLSLPWSGVAGGLR